MSDRYEIIRPRTGLVVFKEGSRARLAETGERVRIAAYYERLLADPDRPVEVVRNDEAASRRAAPKTKEKP